MTPRIASSVHGLRASARRRRVVFRSPLAAGGQAAPPQAPGRREKSGRDVETVRRTSGPVGATTVVPRSRTSDIGLTQYVQAVTSTLARLQPAWAANRGASARARVELAVLGRSRLPRRRRDPVLVRIPQGDPVVQYDRLADRWVFSEFAFTRDGSGNPVAPFIQCVAVSTSPDATGTWYRYAFQPTSAYFPDAPQLGIWPDGYYFSFNQFTSAAGRSPAQARSHSSAPRC